MTDLENCSLREYNTFGIDVRTRELVKYSSVSELQAFLQKCHHAGIPLPILHIGGGSNLLFLSDFPGIILYSEIKDIEVLSEDEDTVLVSVGAGVTHDDFVQYAIDNGWYGLENLSLIPGQVGAAAVQNIGAYGIEVGDFIDSVHTISLVDGSERIWTRDELAYSYRHSIFKDDAVRGLYTVCNVRYQLNTRFIPHLAYGGLRESLAKKHIDEKHLTAGKLREIIIETRRSKLPDPEVMGNAGSFFMNPVVSSDVLSKIQARYPDVPYYLADKDHVKIPAGWMIEQCGWKGKSLGHAAVHDRQALVLVNKGGATGRDILTLCKAVQESVFREFGIQLVPEVNFIGRI